MRSNRRSRIAIGASTVIGLGAAFGVGGALGVGVTPSAEAATWLGGVQYTHVFHKWNTAWEFFQAGEPTRNGYRQLRKDCAAMGGTSVTKAGTGSISGKGKGPTTVTFHYSCWAGDPAPVVTSPPRSRPGSAPAALAASDPLGTVPVSGFLQGIPAHTSRPGAMAAIRVPV